MQLPLIKKAKSLNIETHVFAWEEGAVGKEFCDYFYPISIIEKEEILEVAKKIRPDGITSISSDLAMHTVNYVANALGLIGNSLECTQATTNKYEMRKRLANGGIPCPRFLKVSVENKLQTISDLKLSYPVIVKPTDRSGSRGVFKVESNSTLLESIEKSLSESFSNEVIIEEFIDGIEISVEFISHCGTHYYLTSTDKITTGAPNFVELEHHQPANISAKLEKRVIETVRAALTQLGVANGASHSEILFTDDKLYIVEIGARMGGDFIGSDLVPLSTGYDFVKGVIEIALGTFTPIKEDFMNEGWCSGVYFADQRCGTIKEVINHVDGYSEIVKHEILAGVGDLIQDPTDSSMRMGYYIYQSREKFETSFPLITFKYTK